MASARLAVQIAVFTIAILFHFARTFLDLHIRKVAPRQSTVWTSLSLFWASLGLVFYVAIFGLGVWRGDDATSSLAVLRAVKAQKFLVPAGLWAYKLSVVSTFPQLGLRPLVVWALQAYLGASFLALVLAYLQLCRPWEEGLGVAYCAGTAEVVTYTALNVAGYFFVMLIPISIIWTAIRTSIAQKTATSIALFLGTGLCVLSIMQCVMTLNLIPYTRPILPTVLVDVELSLGLIVSSLPALWRHIFEHAPSGTTAPTSDASMPPATELTTLGLGFNPRHLGVLPDSLNGSLSVSGDSTPTGVVEPELPDWQKESREALRSEGGGPGNNVHRQYNFASSPESNSREIWENDLEAGPRSPRSMGGS